VIVLVTGGRDYADRARMFAELDRINTGAPVTLVVHGACGLSRTGVTISGDLRGADRWADEWSWSRGGAPLAVVAEWQVRRPDGGWQQNLSAGPERNARMVRHVRAMVIGLGAQALCLAFSGGSGTADCVRRARAAGIRVLEIDK